VNALPSPEYNKKAVWAAIHSSAGTLGTYVGRWCKRPPGYLAIFSTFARLRPSTEGGLLWAHSRSIIIINFKFLSKTDEEEQSLPLEEGNLTLHWQVAWHQCNPRQNYLYLCAELTRPYLFKASFASNHAPWRQDKASIKKKPAYANSRVYDDSVRSA